jgi:DNA-binding ferritin-like protein (Dps family)
VKRVALIQVLGAVAYGERKAYEIAKRSAAAASDEHERRFWRKTAAEELRHHKGFVARLEALGADPDRAMRPYERALDRYHGRTEGDDVSEAMFAYLGEGVADDLLQWLRRVADTDTAVFVDSVLADEAEHEAHAAAELRTLLERAPDGRSRAAAASRRMALHMLWSGRNDAAPMAAFVRLGRPVELLAAIFSGHARRMRAIGLAPFGLPLPVR